MLADADSVPRASSVRIGPAELRMEHLGTKGGGMDTYNEKLVQYYDQHGLELTASSYNLSRETVLRLVGEVRRHRRRWVPIKKKCAGCRWRCGDQMCSGAASCYRDTIDGVLMRQRKERSR